MSGRAGFPGNPDPDWVYNTATMTKPKLLPVEETERLKALGLAVIDNEANAVFALKDRINDDFARACGAG